MCIVSTGYGMDCNISDLSDRRNDFMTATIIIGGVIGIYAAGVIVRKVRRVRQGQYCDCGCGQCGEGCKSKIGQTKETTD